MAKRRRRRKRKALLTAPRLFWGLVVGGLTVWWLGCGQPATGPAQRVRIPEGASFAQVTDSLAAHHVVRALLFFRFYAYVTGAARHVRPGTYGFRQNSGWNDVLRDLREGRELRATLVIPEGWRLANIAGRLARITGLREDSILRVLRDSATVQRYRVPGPTMEGYLYPATYSWPLGTPLDTMIATLVRRYQRSWTPERLARAKDAGMSVRDVVTLASIIQAEGKLPRDLPIISAVYHNRLRIGMPLQADPTVQYVLRQRKDRLLYNDITSVAADPYNTYTHRGLPPGPIGNPSEQAIDAALAPASAPYLYFVSRPDGSNIFSRTLAEHNRAKQQVKALIQAESAAAAAAGQTPPVTSPTSGTAPRATPAPGQPVRQRKR